MFSYLGNFFTKFRRIRDVEEFYTRKDEKKECEYRERVETEEIYENTNKSKTIPYLKLPTTKRSISLPLTSYVCTGFSLPEDVELNVRVLGRIFYPFAFMD